MVTATVLRTNDDLISGTKLLFAQGASLPGKGRVFADLMSADHFRRNDYPARPGLLMG
jgi:hypothetical protein